MGYSIEECDRSCPLCGGKMDEVYGDHGGQSSYYYDRCQRCNVQIETGYEGGYYTENYYVSDIIDGIKDLIYESEENKWNRDYKYLLPYLELFKGKFR